MIKNIGLHRVRCGDIMEDLSELYQGVKCDFFYTDPPWMNLNYWQTLNEKMTGASKKQIANKAFINRIFEVVKENMKPEGILFMEFGKKWNNSIVERAEKYGFNCMVTIEMLYGSPERPCMLNLFSEIPRPLPPNYIEKVYHTKGFNSLQAAVPPFVKQGDIISDPCCGMGYTAKIAKETGAIFYGNELNAKRLEKTIGILEK